MGLQFCAPKHNGLWSQARSHSTRWSKRKHGRGWQQEHGAAAGATAEALRRSLATLARSIVVREVLTDDGGGGDGDDGGGGDDADRSVVAEAEAAATAIAPKLLLESTENPPSDPILKRMRRW